MRILTDIPRFPQQWKTSDAVEGTARSSLAGASFIDLFRLIPDIRQADLIILHGFASNVFSLVLFFCLMPFLKKPIISVDLILRKPHTVRQKCAVRLKKILLKRVAYFIHYFKDLRDYAEIYGISAARSSYLPFKPNIFSDPRAAQIAASETGEYIFTAGRSLRDYGTFLSAIAQVNYPSAMSRQSLPYLKAQGPRGGWLPNKLPGNLTLLEDDGSAKSWFTNLRRARVVVITTLRDSICASGISTYLDAMLLKKCVIISSGPGASDVLTDQAIVVPPEDPAALAQAIKKVWEDPVLREETALRGYRYALSLGGEAELIQRILDRAVSWYTAAGGNIR